MIVNSHFSAGFIFSFSTLNSFNDFILQLHRVPEKNHSKTNRINKVKEMLMVNEESRLLIFRNNRQEVFCEKGVLRNFAKFTGKHLCQSLFFNKVAGL